MLTQLQMQLVPEQLPHLFRLICQISPIEIGRLPVSELMKTILMQSEDLRSLRKVARLTAHRTKNHSTVPGDGFICSNCADQPSKEKCVRVLHARFADQSSIHGAALVPYPSHDSDSMLPKVNLIYAP
jgi:hypothetical protein